MFTNVLLSVVILGILSLQFAQPSVTVPNQNKNPAVKNESSCPADSHRVQTGFGSYCSPDEKTFPGQDKNSRFIDCKRVTSAVNIFQGPSPQSPIAATLRCAEMVQFVREESGWVRIRTTSGKEGFVSFAVLSDKPVTNSEGIGLPEGKLPKKEEEKVLAAELRAIRIVCVVPPEQPDGSQAYSDAGALAKVLRDNLSWEASVCDVKYHAGQSLSLNDRDKYDAYLLLSRRENPWGTSENWESRSVTAILTPLKPQVVNGESRMVIGRWGYTNNLWNPDEMVGLAKRIKKSMGK